MKVDGVRDGGGGELGTRLGTVCHDGRFAASLSIFGLGLYLKSALHSPSAPVSARCSSVIQTNRRGCAKIDGFDTASCVGLLMVSICLRGVYSAAGVP